MFPSNSFSDLHLQYTDKTLVNGRSFLPSDPVAYGLDDGLIFEQLLFPEELVNEACDYGDINFPGSCDTTVEKADDGVDQAGLVDSADRSLRSEVCPSKKSRSKVTGSRKSRSMPRRRTGKTDRHSKIHTAKGLRDRRIRLSVHIARKFFDLQEMLGLDKASKTIEWLLAESQAAIDELCKQNCLHLSTNSTPESAMASEMKEPEEEEGEEKEEQVCGGSKNKEQFTNCMKRDSRDKARARARERTREKLMMKEPNLEDPKQIHEEENHNRPSLDGGFLCTPENGRVLDDFSAPEMNSLSIIEKFLGITSTAAKSSSFPDFDLGNDCYEMIEGINILEGLNHLKYADSVSGSAPNSW